MQKRMRCFRYLLFLPIATFAPVFAQEKIVLLPYATPRQRYHKHFNPNVEGNFTLSSAFAFREDFSLPSCLKVDPSPGIVDEIGPSTQTIPVRGASNRPSPGDFILDLGDANGVAVRSMILEFTLTRPEPLRLFPESEKYTNAPVPALANTVAKLQAPQITATAANG